MGQVRSDKRDSTAQDVPAFPPTDESGVAAILHGSPRTTLDVDVCAPLAEPNLTRIISMLRGLNPKLRMRPDKPPMPEDPARLQGFMSLSLDTDLGAIDFLTQVSGIGTIRTPWGSPN